MAQLLIVTKRCPKTSTNAQNDQDLLGIFEDSHQFSPTEQALFDIRHGKSDYNESQSSEERPQSRASELNLPYVHKRDIIEARGI